MSEWERKGRGGLVAELKNESLIANGKGGSLAYLVTPDGSSISAATTAAPVACWISLLKLVFLGGIFLYSTFKFTVFRLVSWEGVRRSVLLHLTTAHPYELRAADA